MIHTIILLVLVYAALKALFKRKPKDFMEGRLVGRPAHVASEMRGTITPPFELWSVTAARYKADRVIVTRNAFACYASKNLKPESFIVSQSSDGAEHGK